MSLKFPDSMDECIYFTRRKLGEKGSAVVWVFKEKCSKCKKAIMGKPKGKDGKVKIRAKEYICEACGNIESKAEHEESLSANIQYTCPHCSNKGEVQIPFIRKKVKIFNEAKQKKVSIESLRFQCEACAKDIDITKKMKK